MNDNSKDLFRPDVSGDWDDRRMAPGPTVDMVCVNCNNPRRAVVQDGLCIYCLSIMEGMQDGKNL